MPRPPRRVPRPPSPRWHTVSGWNGQWKVEQVIWGNRFRVRRHTRLSATFGGPFLGIVKFCNIWRGAPWLVPSAEKFGSRTYCNYITVNPVRVPDRTFTSTTRCRLGHGSRQRVSQAGFCDGRTQWVALSAADAKHTVADIAIAQGAHMRLPNNAFLMLRVRRPSAASPTVSVGALRTPWDV